MVIYLKINTNTVRNMFLTPWIISVRYDGDNINKMVKHDEIYQKVEEMEIILTR